MYTKNHLLTTKIASKTSIKPELTCIAYYGDKVIATDSHRMLEIPVEDGVALDKPDLRIASSAKMPHGFVAVDEPLGVKLPNAGEYPDMNLVMKTMREGEFTTISVNGKLFGELLMQMAKVNERGKVTLRVPVKPGKAIILEAPIGKVTSYIKATGLMMPLSK